MLVERVAEKRRPGPGRSDDHQGLRRNRVHARPAKAAPAALDALSFSRIENKSDSMQVKSEAPALTAERRLDENRKPGVHGSCGLLQSVSQLSRGLRRLT
ncbi:MAG TPA: hypothetical protein VFO57_02085, partial [Burkholderiales bacterium]|nr:hypothetical protein [Burkholderiales bacterium]